MGRLNDTDEIGVGTVSAADLIRIFSFEQMETAVTIVDSDLETGRFCVEFVDKRLHKSRNFVSTAVLAQRIDELLTGQAVEQGFGEPCVGFGLDRLEGLLSVFFSQPLPAGQNTLARQRPTGFPVRQAPSRSQST